MHHPATHSCRFVCLQLFSKYSSHCNTTAAQLQTDRLFFICVFGVTPVFPPLPFLWSPGLFRSSQVVSPLFWLMATEICKQNDVKRVYLGYLLFFQIAENPEGFSAPYWKICFEFVQFKNVFKVLQVWGLFKSIKSGAYAFVLLPCFCQTDASSTEEEQIPAEGLRADVFMEAQPVRCVRSLWAQWHFCDMVLKVEKLTGSVMGRPVLAMRLTVMWQQHLKYYGRNLPSGMMWRWVRQPPSLSAKSTLQRRKWLEP